MYKNSPEAEEILNIFENKILKDEYKIVDYKVVSQKKQSLFKVCIYHENGIKHDDCAIVSRILDDILEEKWEKDYAIEVASPGIGRKLSSIKEFSIFKDREIKIFFNEENDYKTNAKIYKIIDINNDEVTLSKQHENQKDEDNVFSVKYDEIKKAVLI